MAMFLVMAWAVQLGEFIGFVKTVPLTPEGRAYERAQQGAQWLRYHLAKVEILSIQPSQLEIRERNLNSDEPSSQLSYENGRVFVSSNQGARTSNLVQRHFTIPEEAPEFELGPDSWLRFSQQGQTLLIELQAGDDSLGTLGTSQTKLMVPLTQSISLAQEQSSASQSCPGPVSAD
jgi:hypothetical protein